MKYFKLFLTVCAMAVAISASAQSKTTAKSKTATSTAKTTTAAPAKKATTTTAKPAAAAPKAAAKPATTTTKTTTTTTAKAAAKPAKETKSSEPKSYAASDFDTGVHFMMETKIGSYYGTGGIGENFVLEKQFHKYIAVDFFSVDFAMPFKIKDYKCFNLGLKTGVRGFTPRFWGGKACGYASLALGYDCFLADGGAAADIARGIAAGFGIGLDDDDIGDPGWGASHGFALSWGAGLQFVDRVYVGYTMEYSTIFKYTSHYAKIGIRF